MTTDTDADADDIYYHSTDPDFLARLLGEDDPTPAEPQQTRGGEGAFDDPFLVAVMGDDATAPRWPPPSFVPRPGMHAAEEWAGELLRHGQAIRTEILHFPEVLAIQAIEHRGVRHPILPLGLRLMTRASQMSTGRVPRISDGAVWGGVVEIDGRDLLDRRDLWCDIEYAGKAAIVVHDKMAEGIVATLAVAIMAADGMRLRRYIVGPDGAVVQGSDETWVVADGQVRRVG